MVFCFSQLGDLSALFFVFKIMFTDRSPSTPGRCHHLAPPLVTAQQDLFVQPASTERPRWLRSILGWASMMLHKLHEPRSSQMAPALVRFVGNGVRVSKAYTPSGMLPLLIWPSSAHWHPCCPAPFSGPHHFWQVLSCQGDLSPFLPGLGRGEWDVPVPNLAAVGHDLARA